MKKIIEDIKTACSDIFSEKLIFTSLSGKERSYIISGSDLSFATNNHNGTYNQISVLKWFDDFWIYMEFNFKQIPVESKFSKGFDKIKYYELLNGNFLKINNEYYNLIVSLSIFQGGYTKEEKIQLFRAEWDNYEDNKSHPQPHWHFYTEDNKLSETTNDSKFVLDDNIDFLNEIAPKKFDLKRMHFAMNGQWAQNGHHIHKINNPTIVVNWISGLLRHIKEQLEKTRKQK